MCVCERVCACACVLEQGADHTIGEKDGVCVCVCVRLRGAVLIVPLCRYEAGDGKAPRWRHENLRHIVGRAVRSSHGGLSVLCEGGRLHVYYVDTNSEIHELIRWQRWSDNHIHSIVKSGPAPAAAQLGAAYNDFTHLGLVYKGSDGVNYKMCVAGCSGVAAAGRPDRGCMCADTTLCSEAGGGTHCPCRMQMEMSCLFTSYNAGSGRQCMCCFTWLVISIQVNVTTLLAWAQNTTRTQQSTRQRKQQHETGSTSNNPNMHNQNKRDKHAGSSAPSQ